MMEVYECCLLFDRRRFTAMLYPPGGTPYNGLYGEAPPGRGIFFRLQVYERVGNLSFGSVKRPKGLICEFYGFIKSRKPSAFKIDSYSNDSAFPQLKGCKVLNNVCVRGTIYICH